MNIEILFLELIRVAVGVQQCLSRVPSDGEWEMLYKMAEKQALVGVCFAGVQKLGIGPDECEASIGISENLYLKWMGVAFKIKKKNEAVNRRCVELQSKLTEDGWKSCILKGQGNHFYYGSLAMLRQPGDIDVWMDGVPKEIIRYAKGIEPYNHISMQHVDLNIFNGIRVEAHFIPSRWPNRIKARKICAWFAEEKDVQMMNARPLGVVGDITVPTTEFNLVYQMLHINRHLFGEGIGLKQLMDYYFLLQTGIDDDAKSRVVARIEEFGLNRFASALMFVLHEVFGLEIEKMLWSPNREVGQFVLDEIMQMGNFGQKDTRFRRLRRDAYITRYLQAIHDKWRFVKYFPSDVFWYATDLALGFFEVRMVRWRS